MAACGVRRVAKRAMGMREERVPGSSNGSWVFNRLPYTLLKGLQTGHPLEVLAVRFRMFRALYIEGTD